MQTRVIWKYTLTPTTVIDLPSTARILDVQVQHGEPQLWVCLDPKAPRVQRTFITIPTGETFNAEGLQYIATFQLTAPTLVFHVFERRVGAAL